MFHTSKDEHVHAPFSPGFFLYNNGMFFLDEKAKSIFDSVLGRISRDKFLSMLDGDAHSLFLKILKSEEFGNVVIINALTGNSGAVKPVLIQGAVLDRNEEGGAVSFSGYCAEVKNEFSVPRIYNAAEIGLWEWDGVSGKCNFCRDYHRMLGYDWPRESLPDSFEGWKKLVHPEDVEAVLFQEKLSRDQRAGDKFECFIRLRHKNGEYIWTIGKGFVAQRDHLGRAISIRGTNQNIDIVQKNCEKTLERSFRDYLTNCYNRTFFKEYWEKVTTDGGWPISFLYVDICGLKMVNDLLGHDVGDKMILRLVNIMESVIQMSKYIIRMGGDEFLVVLPECGMELIAECEKNLNKYMKFKNEGKDIPVVFSVGSSSLYGKEDSLEDAIHAAERRMQRHKEATRREDLLFLKSYIEAVKNTEVAYQDSRLYPVKNGT